MLVALAGAKCSDSPLLGVGSEREHSDQVARLLFGLVSSAFVCYLPLL